MSLTAFLKENAIQIESVSYVASERFIGEDGEPMEWKIRVLDGAEFDEIYDGAQKVIIDPSNPKARTKATDNLKLRNDLLLACVVHPNLADVGLQDSYGVKGELNVLKKMLTAGEFIDLANAVQQASGFDVGMEERIEEAKN